MYLKLPFFLLLWLTASAAFGQNTCRAIVRDSVTHEALVGATVVVHGTANGASADAKGKVTLENIPEETVQLDFSSLGYKAKTMRLTLPQAPGESLLVLLAPNANELEEIVVTSTRTNSRIEDLPTRVEVLCAEELEEEGSFKPGNIVSLLGDVASMQVQPTSATTGNADLRIQGLQGKYTQLLRDGLPLFGGYAGSFGILQIPPLDLRQVEIIKGASSTLYGGGAIAGMINLISKEPLQNAPEHVLLLNQSTLRESNANGYFSARHDKVGYTLFVGGTRQQSVDVNHDDFSDVPRLGSVTVHPRFFLYPNDISKVIIGYTSTYEKRQGGDMQVLNDKPDSQHQFFITNVSWRNTVDARYERTTNAERGDQLIVKGSASDFRRVARTNTTGLNARQLSYYAEGSYLRRNGSLGHHDVVLGANVTGESFRPRNLADLQLRPYNYVTPGVFVQDDWKLTAAFNLQTGLRIDRHNCYGTFVLPRLSALYKFSARVSSRLGGGLGYKAPSFFVNELDERDFAHVLPFASTVRAEQSAGANWDLNYQLTDGEFSLTINQSFFLTRIQHPLLLNFDPTTGFITFFNAPKPFLTRGFETYVRMREDETELYLGYVFTDARKRYDTANPYLSLIARHKLAGVGTYEFSEHWRAGLEASYIGKQYLDDGTTTPGYPIMAAMARYATGPLAFVLNTENLLNYRITRKENIVLGDRTNPTFRQLWAPLEGRVTNLSVTAKF
ncbi:TonB-dependent receptor [Hymenobacter sp. BT491]|uniref:TonB-dependent receptor n=1 Tax=Hymenobacter sp. BT491 TaxID=2766779 RepID=UPI0016537DBC|nr:TonB-dependent receptor [Hymenobacter sp. BT491]MBC6988222.1 TonB-dependent receptor [Hymenobacter sp. BT491]